MKDFLPSRQPVNTSYSADSTECLEACLRNGSTPTGQVSKDGKRVYVCCGSQVEVLDANNGQRIASWSYGHCAGGGRGQQAAAASETASAATSAAAHEAPRILCADAVDDHASRLLLGLALPPAESGSRVHPHGGLVCLFDVPSCKVIRAFELPYPVTAVSVLTTYFADCGRLVPLERWKWWTLGGGQEPEGCLSYFAGAAAVGTEHGGIYVLDLCLDDDAAWSSSELVPLTCRSLAPPPLTQDGGHAWLIDQRRSCRAQRAALAFQLAGPKRGRYSYMRPDDYLIKALNSDEAAVTSVQFIPEMGALCVGFGFGSFQLWSLSPLALDYSSRYEERVPPVVAFAHQLPEDDPRNFCYLWVVHCYGSQVVETSSGGCCAPELVLHQLEYAGKSIDEQYGWTTFQELSTIAPRLEHRLQPDRDANRGDDGSWFVACHTLPDVSRVPSNCYQNDSVDEDIRHHGYVRNSGLCLFSWCVLNHDETTSKSGITYQFSIFDINRWYHAQMPQAVRPAPGDDVCPFFANYSLGDNHELSLSSLLDVAVDTTTISRYSFPVGIAGEQALWPSTLRLSAVFMFSTGTVDAVFLGLQGQVIQDIVRAGPAVLARPRAVHRQLVDARLSGAAATNDDNVMREEVLSILLQHGQVDFILRCVREWSCGGGDSAAGCDLKFLLRWAWSQAARLKASFDAAAVCLFDCNGVPLDEITARQLSDCSRQLDLLSDVLQCLHDAQRTTGGGAPITDAGYQELGVKVTVLSLITLYARAVVWCHTVGMLPEDIRASDDSSDEWLYLLRRAYDAERLELRQQVLLRSSWLARDTSATADDDQDTLIIDGLVSQCGDSLRALWSSESGASLPYPPTSVHSMVTMLLLKDGDPQLKTSIFFYFVLDFISIHSDCAEKKQMACTDDVVSMLSVPETRANLITGFWLLDHDRIEESVDRLSDPSVATSMEPWQSRRVLTRLLSQGHHAAALRIVRLRQTCCASDDSPALVLGALLANGCIREAFRLLREENSREADPGKVAALFSILLDEWQKKRLLGDVLSLPFSSSDEDFLVQYLTRHSRQDLVIMHKLQQASIDDALRLNRDARMPERSADAEVRARNATRAIIVDWYARTIPAIRHRVAGVSTHYPPRRRALNELRRPVPLSAVAIRSGGCRRTAPAATAATSEAPPSGSRDASRPFLADILDQICELHEHERLQQQSHASAVTADRAASAVAMDRGQHELTSYGAAATAADAATSIYAAVRSSPTLPPRPFVQTPMHLRSEARLVRPSPMAMKVCKRDELVEKAVSLKRPLSPSPMRVMNADLPSAKSQRLSTEVASSTVGEHAWALLQTPSAHRRSPLSRTRPGVADTPVMKFALLPTPQSILKTRLPTAAAAQQQKREAFASTSGDAFSSASALTSTAKKGVSFVGLGASPDVLAGDSPISEAASVQRAGEVKNRRQTAIMPASGLKPLKEFGLPLPTPPRYDRTSTTKVPAPATAVTAPSRLLNDNEDVRPKCILFDEEDEEEEEEEDDSEEMLSAEDTSFPGHTPSVSLEEAKTEQQVQVEQSHREETSALTTSYSNDGAAAASGSSRTPDVGVQQTIDGSSNGITSSGAASELLNRCETGAESTTAPDSFVSRSSDDATSAAASAALLESSDSAVTLSEGKTGSDGHEKQSSIAVDVAVAYTDAAMPGKEQVSVAVNVTADSPLQPSDEPHAENAETLAEPAECRTRTAAARQLSHDDRTDSVSGDSPSSKADERGFPSHSLGAFAMSSGLALRSQVEWAARLEAAYVRDAQSCDATGSVTSVVTPAVAPLVCAEQPATFAPPSETGQARDVTASDVASQRTQPLEPAVEPNFLDGSAGRSSDSNTVSPAGEEYPTQGSIPANDRTTNSDMSLLTAAVQPHQPVLGSGECSAPVVASAATPMEEEEEKEAPEATAATAAGAGSSVSTDAGPELRHRKSVIRPFTFVPPSAIGGDDEPPPSRSSGRRQSNRRRTAVVVVEPADGRPAMGGSAATGSGDQGLADHSAAGGAGRRSLRPRSSFKQDMVSAVGELLEPESKTAGAAALPPRETRWSSKRVNASSDGGGGGGVGVPPVPGVAAETAAEAAADSVATSGSRSTRSKAARSRQESGDSAVSSGGRMSAAPSVTGAAAAAVGQRSLLPPLAEAAAAEAEGDDASSASHGHEQLAAASAADRPSSSGGGVVSARKATRRARYKKQPEASTAISFSAAGDDGDGGSATAALPPPPTPFRDGLRRLRGMQVQPESAEVASSSAVVHEASSSSASRVVASATEPCVTPQPPLLRFAETQSQRSTRSRTVKADHVSNTPINFTPASHASTRKAASSTARGIAAAALRPGEQESASPLKMTLRNRQSKKS